jgi:hypothetical protein
VLRLQISQFETRYGVELDQPALGVQLDLALLDQSHGLHDLGLARLVRQHRDHFAFLDKAAAANVQFGQDAAGAGNQSDLLVGFGAAGQQQLAMMLHQTSVQHGDAERRCRGHRWLNRGTAFRRFMR